MQKKMVSWAANILWFSPLFLAFLLSFTCVGFTSLDSGLYLKKAVEFSQGQFDWGFRPGFILLLGGIFKALGPTIWSATVLIRFFFLANVVLVFYITKYLLNKQAAFAASLALLTSFYLSFLSHRVLLDNIHPFFVLLAIFLSIVAIDRHSDKLAIVAGIVYIYAYLVKSTTLLFMPFPILLVLLWDGPSLNLSKWREGGIVCGTSALGVVIYYFVMRLATIDQFAARVLKGSSSQAAELLVSDTIAGTLHNVLQGFISFWEKFIFQDIFLGWIFVAAWIWIFLRSVKHKYSRVNVAIFLLFVPGMLFLGLARYRLGQSGVFLFATFIPLGILLHDLGKGMGLLASFGEGQHIGLSKYLTGTIILVFTVTFAIYQICYAKVYSGQCLGDTHLVRLIKGDRTNFELQGSLDEPGQKSAEIIAKHAHPGATIFTGFSNLYAIDFFSDFQYNVSRLPCKTITGALSLSSNFCEKLPSGTIDSRLLFLWPKGWTKKLQHWNSGGELRFLYVEESDLRRRFAQDFPVFVAPDHRYDHFGDYLENMSGVKKIHTKPDVYRVDNFQLLEDYKPRVAYEIGMLLNELRSRNHANYNVLRNEFFPRYFGFTPEQVDALADMDAKAAGVVFIGLPGRKY